MLLVDLWLGAFSAEPKITFVRVDFEFGFVCLERRALMLSVPGVYSLRFWGLVLGSADTLNSCTVEGKNFFSDLSG